jgi:hypothetical protein
MDSKAMKRLFSMSLPFIRINQKIYIPMLDDILTTDSIKKYQLDNILNPVTFPCKDGDYSKSERDFSIKKDDYDPL